MFCNVFTLENELSKTRIFSHRLVYDFRQELVIVLKSVQRLLQISTEGKSLSCPRQYVRVRLLCVEKKMDPAVFSAVVDMFIDLDRQSMQ